MTTIISTDLGIEAVEIEALATPTKTSERITRWLAAGKTKSYVIRKLASEGVKVVAINKAFSEAGVKMRYQHVRNVLTQVYKKGIDE